jgi:hypothetical protein
LAGLSLENRDLEALRGCTSGNCRVKLTAPEVDILRREIPAAGANRPPAVDNAFRRIVPDRVRTYKNGGHRALGRYSDGRSPPLDVVFGSLLGRTPCLTRRFTALSEYLETFPERVDPAFETFFYWSKERLGGKPIVAATQVVVARGNRDWR